MVSPELNLGEKIVQSHKKAVYGSAVESKFHAFTCVQICSESAESNVPIFSVQWNRITEIEEFSPTHQMSYIWLPPHF